MSDLKEIRIRIDSVDREIQRLFEERMHLSEEVACVKAKNGLPVLDERREQEKIASLRASASDQKTADGITELYRTIFSVSRKCQEEKLKNVRNK